MAKKKAKKKRETAEAKARKARAATAARKREAASAFARDVLTPTPAAQAASIGLIDRGRSARGLASLGAQGPRRKTRAAPKPRGQSRPAAKKFQAKRKKKKKR